MKRVMVLGGDGFCGWPLSLRLSAAGHEVGITDNLSKRDLMEDLGVPSLTPIKSIQERINAWKKVSGKELKFNALDLSIDYGHLLRTIKSFEPDTIVHYAEQPSAPLSMKNSEFNRFTVSNNLLITNNVLCAIVESGLDIHLVHLGTMGVYGYGTAGIEIPEGYLQVLVKDDQERRIGLEIPYPPNPGSIYHMTKTQDALFLQFYKKNYRVRITDLHQGIVWGTNTKETLMHEDLINVFRYDGDLGTVLNRFLVQAAVGHPLTVHGSGGQTRAFIHLENSVDCVELAINNPPDKDLPKVRIFNQMTETHRIIELAQKISEITGAKIKHYHNPRVEADENELKVANTGLKDLGLNPIKLSNGLMVEVRDIAEKYKDRVRLDKIICKSLWNDTRIIDGAG